MKIADPKMLIFKGRSLIRHALVSFSSELLILLLLLLLSGGDRITSNKIKEISDEANVQYYAP